MNHPITPRYERPVIVRHALGGWDKFGAASALRPVSHLGQVPIDDLVEAYGSPLFVFTEQTLRNRIRELRDQLARRFSDFTIAWSYKTNYLGAICAVFHEEGAWAEVVSGFELEKALRAGVPGSQIIFNGPSKSAQDINVALREGVQMNIDHLDELALIERVAEQLDLTPRVGIRINLTDLPVDQWDRFGFTLENGRAIQAVRRLMRGGRLQLVGLHCHIGTFILDTNAYRMQALAMGRFAQELERDHDIHIESIDLGGGFASHNTLHQQYLPGEESTPSLGQYVEAIAEGLDEAYDGAAPPRVVLETGRGLVDDAGSLVATVLANKRLVDGRRAVVVDAGVNILPTAWWYRHAIYPAQETQGVSEPTVFFGPLCMNIDVVRKGVMFPPLQPGDRIVIAHTGAYNVTQWQQFITMRPNVVMVSPDQKHSAIRRAETVDTLLVQEEMPEWLQQRTG